MTWVLPCDINLEEAGNTRFLYLNEEVIMFAGSGLCTNRTEEIAFGETAVCVRTAADQLPRLRRADHG